MTSASWPDSASSHVVTRGSEVAAHDLPVGRRCRRPRARAGRRAATRANAASGASPAPRSSRAVKRNTLPSPGTEVGASARRPSARRAGARSRARARCRRSAGWSSCPPARRARTARRCARARCRSRCRDTSDAHQQAVAAALVGADADRRPRRPAVNLTALEIRLVSTWRRRPASPRTTAGTCSSTQTRQLDALGVRLVGEHRGRVLDHLAQVEVADVELELAAPRSSRSRGCR